MKFNVGDIVRKKTGYTFIGKVVSAYIVKGGNRYDVQVDAEMAVTFLNELMRTGKCKLTSAKDLMTLEELLRNCDGMIHIFSEEQLEIYE